MPRKPASSPDAPPAPAAASSPEPIDPTPAEVTRDEVAEVFENIARLLALDGENPFKVRAYQNGARAVEMFAGNLREAFAGEASPGIPGLGEALVLKVKELVATGRLEFYERLRERFPGGILELFEIPGLGEKKIKVLYDQLKVTSVAKLEEALRAGTVATLPGFGAKTAQNLLAAIERRKEVADLFRLGDVAADAFAVHAALREQPDVIRVSPAGSFLRRKEIVHDLDFVVSTREPEAVGEFFTTLPNVRRVEARGPTKVSVRLASGVPCDLRLVTDAQYPFALQHFTGSKEHNLAFRQRVLARGWTLNEYRLAAEKPDAAPVPEIRDEAGIYAALGLAWIPPELRENAGEWDAAASGASPGLPRLVELENLRGTFHCHTTASDGRDSLRAMAEAARELGFQYLGIADHSKASFQANGLDAGRLLAQFAEILALNAEFAPDFRLFAGTECDILKDGSLDFPDEVLAQLDYVVASVHASFTLPEAEQTRRLIRAMANPHVTMLGHSTGRLLLTRPGYAVDLAAVIEAAAATGTIIELNANPRRLDLDWRWWHRARDAGVRCAINPDAHRTAGFQDLWFGVAAARKGWLRREDVVNCLPLGEIEKALGAKRAKAGL